MMLAILCSLVTAVQTPADWVAAEIPRLTSLYEGLHANPELSFHEVESAKQMAAQLRAADFSVIAEQIGGTGVVGVLKNGDGPVVLVRTDMDALPIEEKLALLMPVRNE